ncbi:type II toxin-antitoxin system ParD family antitoxin (plasmid) [Roseibium porphyridii]|uniref:Type II toxin-antitoxin system ParD family antitoxin n=1 Tax=Roseibium porphyridii TaxID=2866279 RepID=A0ABY8FB11_9HYPH|nr:type II toxin-antitoxin system ParD family antitoxin [Roseibium sp. KMA01]WFE92651.1 type II toxin-antitoxin system ParD family antitoxin [Roseibium sp. KMA01]
MSMVKKSISVTDQQDEWIRAEVAKGYYGNDSEVIRALIRERQLQQQETPEQIEAIRAKLIEAERSGFADKSVKEIWEEARQQAKAE